MLCRRYFGGKKFKVEITCRFGGKKFKIEIDSSIGGRAGDNNSSSEVSRVCSSFVLSFLLSEREFMQVYAARGHPHHNIFSKMFLSIEHYQQLLSFTWPWIVFLPPSLSSCQWMKQKRTILLVPENGFIVMWMITQNNKWNYSSSSSWWWCCSLVVSTTITATKHWMVH